MCEGCVCREVGERGVVRGVCVREVGREGSEGCV